MINRESPVHDNDYILFLVDSKRIFYSNTTTYTVKCIVIPIMNKTRNILMVTAIITLLFIGTKALPMQTIVQAQRDTQDEKRSIKQETTAQSANQKSVEDNTCVR